MKIRSVVERLKEQLCTFIAWRLPRRLVMWCAIRLLAHATTGRWSTQIVPELNAMDALQRWETATSQGKGTDHCHRN